MSNQCCPIAIDFTVCTACCICRAGQSIIHMQYIVKSSLISFSSSYYLQKVLGCENIFENHKISYGAGIGLQLATGNGRTCQPVASPMWSRGLYRVGHSVSWPGQPGQLGFRLCFLSVWFFLCFLRFGLFGYFAK